MADETKASQPAPEVARSWHAVLDGHGAQCDTDYADVAPHRVITIVEQPPREAVEALLDDIESCNGVAAARSALLRLWGFDA